MPNRVPDPPRWRRYLRLLGPDVAADTDDELHFHLEERAAEYVAQGMSAEEAKRCAREWFGDLAAVRRELADHDRARERSRKRTGAMRDLMQDLRLARRGFRRTPAFFATAVLILTLGIGLSVAIFTVFRTVLIRQLPVVDQDRVVVMWTYGADPTADLVTGTRDLSVVRQESRTLSAVAAVAHRPATPSPFASGDRSVMLNRGMVTGNFFDVLGVRPALGRLLRSGDDEPAVPPPLHSNGPSRALVLSYRAWQQTFGGDSSAVGRDLVEPLIQGRYTIVGVAPPGFDYPAGADYWIPMWSGWHSEVSAFAVGRLAPGATVEAAREEYFTIQKRLDEQRPQPLDLHGAHAATFTETVLGNVRPVLALLTAAVALLLLIACLNVGNLLLLRASSRTREIAVRRALGASFGRIARQLVVEAVAIATTGGVLGCLLAAALLRLLVAYAPPKLLPRLDEVQLAGTPIMTAVFVTAVAVLLFGLAPALLAARTDLAAPLRNNSRAGRETRRRRAVRQTLVVSQIALAVLMLGGAGLLARSLERLERQETGFVSDHLSVAWYSWNVRRYDSWPKTLALGDRLVRRIQEVPGVTAATQVVVPPLVGKGIWRIPIETENDIADDAADRTFSAEFGGAEFFRTFGVPVLRGRVFTESDRQGAPLVAIVSESVAQRLWPDQDPIGQQLRVPGASGESLGGGDAWRTVVGVAHDTHLRTVREATPTVYFPSLQGFWQGHVAIRSSRELSELLPALGAAGHDVDPELELWSPRTMDEVLAEPLAQPRLSALLMSSFGLVALLLAAIGLFGVMASLVHERTREFGVRMALGATPARVRRQVLAGAAAIAGAGVAVGLAASLAASRLMNSVLFQVSPTDPIALIGACVVLLVVAGAAAYLPARRATAIDPMEALRAD
jgi:putative ABC transport system permease protein